MPIEFRCTKCDRLLRTPDGTAGKSAKCPQCGTVTTVPDTGQTPPPPPQPADSFSDPESQVPPGLRDTIAAGDSSNPYRSPVAHGIAASGPGVDRGFRPTRIDMGDVFSRTWEIFKQNFGDCVVAGLIFLAAVVVAGGIVAAMSTAAMNQVEGIAYVAAWLIQQIALQAVGWYFALGMIAFMLRVARGEPTDFSVLFSGHRWIVYGVAVQIIVQLAVAGGLVLLIVPGIIIGLMLSQSLYMLVDQGTDISGSLSKSVEATDGNKWTLFATYVVAGIASMVVALVTCGLGVLVVVPYMNLLAAVIYLGMTGQKTVLDDLEQPAVERGLGPAGAPY